MQRWVRWVGWVKGRAPGKAFQYFTYGELILWFVEAIVWRQSMWQWGWFVATSLGQAGPRGVHPKATVEMKGEELRKLVDGEY